MSESREKIYLEVPEFAEGGIDVRVAARILGKTPQYVRQGILQGILPIGSAVRTPGCKRYSYYISPKLFWEYTGYVYTGEK